METNNFFDDLFFICNTVKPVLTTTSIKATTCQQRPLFWGPNMILYNINDLWTTTTCQQWPLFLGPAGGRCTQVWLYIKYNLLFVDYLYERQYLIMLSYYYLAFIAIDRIWGEHVRNRYRLKSTTDQGSISSTFYAQLLWT